ncbi:MAG: hypothetical protein QOI74_3209, partial [Micromonosporaceae bacterium]|nr:hypothetical protein [Micromonosporaceae bacterium]
MMRNSLPKLGRRAAVSSIVAVALSASGALSPAMSAAHAATPTQMTISQTLSQLSDLWAQQTGERPEENTERRLPSPPRPSWMCPNERVVLGGTRT